MAASCEHCVSCQGCNSCQGCYTCLRCNRCETCNNCQAPVCQTAQALCTIESQYLNHYKGNFDFSACYSSGEIMGVGYFDKDVWDELSDWISTRAEVGAKENGGTTVANSSVSAVDPFSAAEFNRMARIVGAGTVNKEDIIRGSYFSNLVSAANRIQIKSTACDLCNIACDANGCDKCLSVDHCTSCNNGLSNCRDRDPKDMCDTNTGGN